MPRFSDRDSTTICPAAEIKWFSLLQRLPALRISIAWLYGAVVVAGILMTIYAAANLLETRRGRNVRADSAGESGMQHAE